MCTNACTTSICMGTSINSEHLLHNRLMDAYETW